MKGDVAEAEVKALVFEGQLPKPIDFDEVHLRQMSEPRAALANHFARDVDAKHLVEFPRQRLQKPARSAADLQDTLAPRKNLRHAFEDELHIPFARLPEGSFVLRIV